MVSIESLCKQNFFYIYNICIKEVFVYMYLYIQSTWHTNIVCIILILSLSNIVGPGYEVFINSVLSFLNIEKALCNKKSACDGDFSDFEWALTKFLLYKQKIVEVNSKWLIVKKGVIKTTKLQIVYKCNVIC